MNPTRRALACLMLVAVLSAVPIAAHAAPLPLPEVVAADSSGTDGTGTVIGMAPSSTRTGPVARAALPRGIVVTQHGGEPVALFAKGLPPVRKSRPGTGAATFTGLRAGTTYTVIVGGRSIGHVTAIDRPLPATRLVVRTSDSPSAVALAWRQTSTPATGGSSVRYDVVASSTSAPRVTAVSKGRSARISGLDPTALYTFTVTPRNSAGRGASSTARMTRTLAQIAGTSPATPAPVPAPTPTPTPTPAPTSPSAQPPAPPQPAPGPATTTIYVCPDGFAQVGSMCQRTMAYTYDIKPYTYHQEPVYGYGQTGWDYASGYCTGPGTSGNWENGDPYCRTAVYGWGVVVGSQTVKDATPAGYTDTGTDWRKRNSPPDGYVDDGTQWVKTVPMVARVVPA